MKSKYVVALFVLMVLLFVTSGCARAEEVAPVEPTLVPTQEPVEEVIPQGLVLVDEEFDYSSPDEFAQNWNLNLDRNYCPDIPADLASVSREVINSNGNNLAMIKVNEGGVPGLFINAILNKTLERCDKCTIVASAYGGVPPRPTLAEQEKAKAAGEPEQEEQMINISFEVCNKGTCWYGEVFYYLNKWVTEDNYKDFGLGYYAGTAYTRYVDHATGIETVKVLENEIGDDRKFHHFEIQVSIDVANDYYMIDHIRVDDQELVPELEMWPEKKEAGYADVMQIFLETHNMWTECDPQHNFTATSLWDKVKVTQYPFGEGSD